jgi:hypothetical protein
VLKLSELIGMLHDLSGSILKKAELTGDFRQTYSYVFEKIMEIEIMGKEEVLEVFGNIGG